MEKTKCKHQYKNKNVSGYFYRKGIAIYCKLAEQPCLAQRAWITQSSHCGGNYNVSIFGYPGEEYKVLQTMEECPGRDLAEGTEEAIQFKNSGRDNFAKELELIIAEGIRRTRIEKYPKLEKLRVSESVLFEGGSKR